MVLDIKLSPASSSSLVGHKAGATVKRRGFSALQIEIGN